MGQISSGSVSNEITGQYVPRFMKVIFFITYTIVFFCSHQDDFLAG